MRGEGWLHQRQRVQAAGDQLMPRIDLTDEEHAAVAHEARSG